MKRNCSTPGTPVSATTNCASPKTRWAITAPSRTPRLRVAEDALGDNGTISHTPQTIRYYPQKVNRKDGNEMTGIARSDPKAHMQNFCDSIRGGAQPNCPFEIGFRVS